MAVPLRPPPLSIALTILPPGKLPSALLERLLKETLANCPLPEEVLLGPRPGEDACAIGLGGGALVAAADPITLTGSDVGKLAVLVNANDVAVTGVRPRWFLATVLFPLGTSEQAVENLFASMQAALKEFEIALVGGHSEVSAAVNQTIVVGQMLGYSETGYFVPTGGLVAGDKVLQIGPAPVEGAAVLAARTPPDDDNGVAPDVIAAACAALDTPGILVVEAALTAASHGATALHDPTEGGLLSGLWELADASGVELSVRENEVQWFPPGVTLCRHYNLDPWGTLASGCLLAGISAAKAVALVTALENAGHRVTVIATASLGKGVLVDGRPARRFARDELSRLDDV